MIAKKMSRQTHLGGPTGFACEHGMTDEMLALSEPHEAEKVALQQWQC
jgi:hypothetical protein